MRRDCLATLAVAFLFCGLSLWAQQESDSENTIIWPLAPCSAVTSGGTATTNSVAKFTAPCNIESSAMTETGGKVGIGTTTPAGTLDVKGSVFVRGTLQLPSTGTATATKGFNSQPLDAIASAFGPAGAVNQHFRWQAEPVNNNTTNPTGKFNLLFASGTGLGVGPP